MKEILQLRELFLDRRVEIIYPRKEVDLGGQESGHSSVSSLAVDTTTTKRDGTFLTFTHGFVSV